MNLPRLNDDTSCEQQRLSEFLSRFHGSLKDEISLENIRPALSAEIYTTTTTTTSFNNWKNGIHNLNIYDYVLHSMSDNTLVIVLGRQSPVNWGDTRTVHNLTWDIIVVYFDVLHKRIFL